MPSVFFPPIVESTVISSSAVTTSPPTNIVPLVILPFGHGTRSSELRWPNSTDAAHDRFVIGCIVNLTAPCARIGTPNGYARQRGRRRMPSVSFIGNRGGILGRGSRGGGW